MTLIVLPSWTLLVVMVTSIQDWSTIRIFTTTSDNPVYKSVLQTLPATCYHSPYKCLSSLMMIGWHLCFKPLASSFSHPNNIVLGEDVSSFHTSFKTLERVEKRSCRSWDVTNVSDILSEDAEMINLEVIPRLMNSELDSKISQVPSTCS